MGEHDIQERDARARNRKKQFERRLYAQINRRPDILWQESPPRVLAYSPDALQQYGWVPYNIFNWRNMRATVFSSGLLNLQTIALLLWVGLLQSTGLGISAYNLYAFLKIWGTVYAGSVFNLSTVVVFILGLFTTLVINRWWSIRTAHTRLVSACMDLATLSVHSVRDVSNLQNPSVNRARVELIRLVNLVHVLVCMAADGANKVYGKRRWQEHLHNIVPALFPQQTVSEPSDGAADFTPAIGQIGWIALQDEGLVNTDEWEQILVNEAFGMPRYMTAMYWVEALLHQCRAAEFLVAPQESLQSMLTKVTGINDSANAIFTFIRCQMPYPYVHLVTFTVHVYLIYWASYIGILLHVGIPDGQVTQSAVTEPITGQASVKISAGILSQQEEVQLMVKNAHKTTGWWNLMWMYASVAFANIIFQGLLNMHALLDNPYGEHCCKFPLRAQVIELMNATRTLLTRSDILPSMFGDIFEAPATSMGSRHDRQGLGAPAPGSVQGSAERKASESEWQEALTGNPGYAAGLDRKDADTGSTFPNQASKGVTFPDTENPGADGHVQLATSADGDTTKHHRLPSSVWRDEQGSHLDPVQLLTQPATQVGLSADKRFLLRGLEGALSMYSPRETLQSAGSMLQRVSAHRSQAGFDAAPPHQRSQSVLGLQSTPESMPTNGGCAHTAVLHWKGRKDAVGGQALPASVAGARPRQSEATAGTAHTVRAGAASRNVSDADVVDTVRLAECRNSEVLENVSAGPSPSAIISGSGQSSKEGSASDLPTALNAGDVRPLNQDISDECHDPWNNPTGAMLRSIPSLPRQFGAHHAPTGKGIGVQSSRLQKTRAMEVPGPLDSSKAVLPMSSQTSPQYSETGSPASASLRPRGGEGLSFQHAPLLESSPKQMASQMTAQRSFIADSAHWPPAPKPGVAGQRAPLNEANIAAEHVSGDGVSSSRVSVRDTHSLPRAGWFRMFGRPVSASGSCTDCSRRTTAGAQNRPRPGRSSSIDRPSCDDLAAMSAIHDLSDAAALRRVGASHLPNPNIFINSDDIAFLRARTATAAGSAREAQGLVQELNEAHIARMRVAQLQRTSINPQQRRPGDC